MRLFIRALLALVRAAVAIALVVILWPFFQLFVSRETGQSDILFLTAVLGAVYFATRKDISAALAYLRKSDQQETIHSDNEDIK